MEWWVIGAIAGFFVARHLWKTYNHPHAVLGRQAANMNWVARGHVKDQAGYRNLRLVRGKMEAELTFKPISVLLIKPPHPKAFSDFMELERWLGAKSAQAGGPQDSDLPDDDASEEDEDSFYAKVEKLVTLRGYGDQLLAAQGLDKEYCITSMRAWAAAEQAKEDPNVVAAFTITSVDYYEKNRDVALSYLKRLESGWNAMVAHPHLAATVRQNAMEEQQLEDDASSYHAAIDRIADRALTFLVNMGFFDLAKSPEALEKLHAELLVYLSASKARRDTKKTIHPMNWNTFKRGMEVRMLAILDDGHERSGVISTPDGGKAFASFASTYWQRMDALDAVLNERGVVGLIDHLLDEMDGERDNAAKFIAFFTELSEETASTLLPRIANLA